MQSKTTLNWNHHRVIENILKKSVLKVYSAFHFRVCLSVRGIQSTTFEWSILVIIGHEEETRLYLCHDLRRWGCIRLWNVFNWTDPWWWVERKMPWTLKGCPQYLFSCMSVCLSFCPWTVYIYIPYLFTYEPTFSVFGTWEGKAFYFVVLFFLFFFRNTHFYTFYWHFSLYNTSFFFKLPVTVFHRRMRYLDFFLNSLFIVLRLKGLILICVCVCVCVCVSISNISLVTIEIYMAFDLSSF